MSSSRLRASVRCTRSPPGLSRGACASILAAFACTLGIVPHLIAAITGLAAVLHASAVAFNLIRYLGVAYLVYLAVRTWRDRTPLVADEDDEPRAPLTVITQGVLINLLNPKLTIFFFAFLPQFVQSDVPGALAEMLVLSGIFMAVTFVVFAIYGVCAAFLRQHVAAATAGCHVAAPVVRRRVLCVRCTACCLRPLAAARARPSVSAAGRSTRVLRHDRVRPCEDGRGHEPARPPTCPRSSRRATGARGQRRALAHRNGY